MHVTCFSVLNIVYFDSIVEKVLKMGDSRTFLGDVLAPSCDKVKQLQHIGRNVSKPIHCLPHF